MNKRYYLIFNSFDVIIKIESSNESIIKKIKRSLKKIFPVNCQILPKSYSDFSKHNFSIEFESNPSQANEPVPYKIFYKGENISQHSNYGEASNGLESKVRLTVAEYAPDYVFLHAGVVEYRNRAIIIPGRSFSGKTSLVVELIKNGCQYLSDEYAIIDRKGLIHSFPKTLSVRGIIDDYSQKEISVTKFGSKVFEQPIRPGWILKANYNKRRKRISLNEITPGEGLLACLDNSISIRRQPKFVLEILGNLTSECLALKAERGEAAIFVPKLLDYLSKNYNNLQ